MKYFVFLDSSDQVGLWMVLSLALTAGACPRGLQRWRRSSGRGFWGSNGPWCPPDYCNHPRWSRSRYPRRLSCFLLAAVAWLVQLLCQPRLFASACASADDWRGLRGNEILYRTGGSGIRCARCMGNDAAPAEKRLQTCADRGGTGSRPSGSQSLPVPHGLRAWPRHSSGSHRCRLLRPCTCPIGRASEAPAGWWCRSRGTLCSRWSCAARAAGPCGGRERQGAVAWLLEAAAALHEAPRGAIEVGRAAEPARENCQRWKPGAASATIRGPREAVRARAMASAGASWATPRARDPPWREPQDQGAAGQEHSPPSGTWRKYELRSSPRQSWAAGALLAAAAISQRKSRTRVRRGGQQLGKKESSWLAIISREIPELFCGDLPAVLLWNLPAIVPHFISSVLRNCSWIWELYSLLGEGRTYGGAPLMRERRALLFSAVIDEVCLFLEGDSFANTSLIEPEDLVKANNDCFTSQRAGTSLRGQRFLVWTEASAENHFACTFANCRQHHCSQFASRENNRAATNYARSKTTFFTWCSISASSSFTPFGFNWIELRELYRSLSFIMRKRIIRIK